MSRSIWTQCEGSSRVRALELTAWRVVESQHITSTRKLVDSDAEQALLEELIERVKPPAPTGRAFAHLHYLFMTPFRHPPLRFGSRFGSQLERGIYYASIERETAFAEVAYYRLLFLAGSEAKIAPITVELTAFTAKVKTLKGVDLSRAPFREFEGALTSKTNYQTTHALGLEMRAAGIQAFVYVSARALTRKKNVGLFEPCFRGVIPDNLETWICTADEAKVEFAEKTFGIGLLRGAMRTKCGFLREQFEVDGALPSPSSG